MYRVDWLQSALDALAAIWIAADASQRQAITAATHELEQRLGANPFQASESRPGRRRTTFVPPLAVIF